MHLIWPNIIKLEVNAKLRRVKQGGLAIFQIMFSGKNSFR
jgi:hypothetical protein